MHEYINVYILIHYKQYSRFYATEFRKEKQYIHIHTDRPI